MRLKFFLISVIFLVLSPLVSSKTFADDYFQRDYQVNYTVQDTGITHVRVAVTLTNKSSDYYASSDTINVGFDDINNLIARDPDGPITPKVAKTDFGNAITLPFNKHSVGKDKSMPFSIDFDTSDIAQHSGKIWEINIPGIANPDDFNNFTVSISVPSSFGQPAYIKPKITSSQLTFNKDQLGKAGISIAFGTEQIYDVHLTYHLGNANLFPIETEIALPPETNYQKVSIGSINPKPKNVSIDQDGNWLAKYALAPSQKMTVQVEEKIQLTNAPSQSEISTQEIQTDTKEQPFWQTSNSQIKQLAAELRTPQAIYDYVVKNLHYDFNRVTTKEPRLGAVAALQQKDSAVCLEFTDLFITLARAAGIPAREINGYAYSENSKQRPLSLVQDILHSWPEYYDFKQNKWIMVDPTWGNTTGGTDYFTVLDFDHITFIQKGQNSQYPIPPGGYKFTGDENKKDITVDFSPIFPTDPPQISVSADFPNKIQAGFAVGGTIRVANTGHILFPLTSGVLASETLHPLRQDIAIKPVPPFGKVDIPVQFAKTPFFTNKSYNFTFSLQGTIIQGHITVTPFLFNRAILIGGVISVISAIIISFLAIKAWGLFISRRS
ncbi:MAG TPA: transglutaminase domain-containing protein [Patescibacteria group bacterium]|nr:transglutaminase domain-containing protein [Patescibacteria group bacterium]